MYYTIATMKVGFYPSRDFSGYFSDRNNTFLLRTILRLKECSLALNINYDLIAEYLTTVIYISKIQWDAMILVHELPW